MAMIVFWLSLTSWVSWFILSLAKKQSQPRKWRSYSCLWWLHSMGCHGSWLVTVIHIFCQNFGKCCLGHLVWSIMLPPHTILKWMAKWNSSIEVWSKSCSVLSPPHCNKTGIWFCWLPSLLWTGTCNTATGHTPAFLVFGWEPELPLEAAVCDVVDGPV